jgi:hypothetical protein
VHGAGGGVGTATHLRHLPSGSWLSGGAHTQPTDNFPQPKEAQPLSQLDIRSIQHFDSSALWSGGAA